MDLECLSLKRSLELITNSVIHLMKTKLLLELIRGHSIPVDVELEEKEPPTVLYHGTGKKYVESIDRKGLIPKSRLYVHLSKDIATAVNVGKRHGEPVVYAIDTAKMYQDGFKFYESANKVWLTKSVPTKYMIYWIRVSK